MNIKSLFGFFIFCLLWFSKINAQHQAKILKSNTPSVNIGGKELSVGDFFAEKGVVKWRSKDQVVMVRRSDGHIIRLAPISYEKQKQDNLTKLLQIRYIPMVQKSYTERDNKVTITPKDSIQQKIKKLQYNLHQAMYESEYRKGVYYMDKIFEIPILAYETGLFPEFEFVYGDLEQAKSYKPELSMSETSGNVRSVVISRDIFSSVPKQEVCGRLVGKINGEIVYYSGYVTLVPSELETDYKMRMLKEKLQNISDIYTDYREGSYLLDNQFDIPIIASVDGILPVYELIYYEHEREKTYKPQFAVNSYIVKNDIFQDLDEPVIKCKLVGRINGEVLDYSGEIFLYQKAYEDKYKIARLKETLLYASKDSLRTFRYPKGVYYVEDSLEIPIMAFMDGLSPDYELIYYNKGQEKTYKPEYTVSEYTNRVEAVMIKKDLFKANDEPMVKCKLVGRINGELIDYSGELILVPIEKSLDFDPKEFQMGIIELPVHVFVNR